MPNILNPNVESLWFWIVMSYLLYRVGLLIMRKASGRKNLTSTSEDDMLELVRKLERLNCELYVLRDLITRAQWYLGNDEQSSVPTREETLMFLKELKGVLHGD